VLIFLGLLQFVSLDFGEGLPESKWVVSAAGWRPKLVSAPLMGVDFLR
jgi:hypothetical protein